MVPDPLGRAVDFFHYCRDWKGPEGTEGTGRDRRDRKGQKGPEGTEGTGRDRREYALDIFT